MTRKELIELGLKGVGRVHTKGEEGSLAVILPYLLADIAYQCQLKGERAIGPLRHKQKKLSTLWHRYYTLFNRPFFSFIPPESHEEVTDLMDSLNEHLSNEIVMLQSGVMQMFDGVEFEERLNVSWLMLAHIFSQFANAAWKNVNRRVKRQSYGNILVPESNETLDRLRDYSFDMAINYLRGLPGGGEVIISSLKSDNIFTVISRKIYEWIKDNKNDSYYFCGPVSGDGRL